MSEFPRDNEGNPLAWEDPDNPGWYLDAWGGLYPSREAALHDSEGWIASEADRTRIYGAAS